MKTIKLFLVAFIATTITSCSNTDESKAPISTTNRVAGTTWTGTVEKASSELKGTYTLNFQKNTNICTMQFNRILKNEQGIIIVNTTVTKAGTYTLDDGWGDRGSIIFPDNLSNNVTMYFTNGQKFRIYINNQILPSTGIKQNHLEVSLGTNYENGAGFQVFFMPNVN